MQALNLLRSGTDGFEMSMQVVLTDFFLADQLTSQVGNSMDTVFL